MTAGIGRSFTGINSRCADIDKDLVRNIPAAGAVCLARIAERAMTARPSPAPPPPHLLQRARELAKEVRNAAERIHAEAEEAHRLTRLARRAAEHGRALSRQARREAVAARDSIRGNLDRARKPGGKDSE